jgi:pimeloyl-ACP methyl ester carboxylesterase
MRVSGTVRPRPKAPLATARGGGGGPALPVSRGWFLDREQDRVAELTTSVLYDRAGTGWSEHVDLPRSAAEVADELRDLLRTAAVPAPYVPAGHSLGAFYARRYAQRFPDEVAGLLLLDPGHEDIFSYLPEQAAELNEQMKPDLEQMPELTNEQLQSSRGAFPLIVLTAMERNPYWAQFMSEQQMREAHDGVHALHAAIAASVPQGEQRVLDDAPHQYLHVKHPDAVLQAIRDLLGKIDKRRQ